MKHGGKYDLVKMDYSASSSNVDKVESIVPIKKESETGRQHLSQCRNQGYIKNKKIFNSSL